MLTLYEAKAIKCPVSVHKHKTQPIKVLKDLTLYEAKAIKCPVSVHITHNPIKEPPSLSIKCPVSVHITHSPIKESLSLSIKLAGFAIGHSVAM
jgi:hypothetical protein